MGWMIFLLVPDIFSLLFRGSKQMNHAMMQHVGCFKQLFFVVWIGFEK